MSKGYPDFFGYSMFPAYGKMSQDNLPITGITTGDTLEAFNFNNKAVIQGGYIGIDGSTNSPFIKIRITIDGSSVFYSGLNIMFAYQLLKSESSLCYLLNYSPAYEQYAIGFKEQITVESDYKVEIVNTSGDTLTVRGDLNYNIIQT